MDEDNGGVENSIERPQLLSILCILTFISSGFSILGCLLMIFWGRLIREFIENSPGMDKSALANIELFENISFWTISLVLVSTSLYGAIKMYGLKKIGFHFYAISNIVVLIIPLIFRADFNMSSLFMTASFLGMYAIHLRYMS